MSRTIELTRDEGEMLVDLLELACLGEVECDREDLAQSVGDELRALFGMIPRTVCTPAMPEDAPQAAKERETLIPGAPPFTD